MGNGDIKVKEVKEGQGLYVRLMVVAYERGNEFGRDFTRGI
jgi:hypothetical protein